MTRTGSLFVVQRIESTAEVGVGFGTDVLPYVPLDHFYKNILFVDSFLKPSYVSSLFVCLLNLISVLNRFGAYQYKPVNLEILEGGHCTITRKCRVC